MTGTAYVDLSTSPMGYTGSLSTTSVCMIPNLIITVRTAFEIRILNQSNAGSAFSGGSWDESWDPGSNTNGVQRAYVMGTFLKVS